MIREEWFATKSPRPTCVGAGLVALDVVIGSDSKSQGTLWAGGSCANALTILSYLGWTSYPVARIGADYAARVVVDDLQKWKVRTDFVFCEQETNTPIVIERIRVNQRGIPRHHFEWSCPNCQTLLPKYKSIQAKLAKVIAEKLPQANVFYFDRIASSVLELARKSKASGALVFFEPSAIKNKAIFSECLSIADIVKYSHERLGSIQELTQSASIPLEIETLGKEGLRYRLCTKGARSRRWHFMEAFPVERPRDFVGSGDWTSAGIIHRLGHSGRSGLDSAKARDINDALRFGQALAAFNCYYEGARGGMYTVTKPKFKSIVRSIYEQEDKPEVIGERVDAESRNLFSHICPTCRLDHRSAEN